MSAPTLAELQLAVQEYLLNTSNTAEQLTLETARFPKQERLNIYYQAYRLRLIDALRHDFPALELFLGDDAFIQMASDFIAQHPSHQPSLRWLGSQLPNFLRQHNSWKTTPILADLAAFEWAQTMAFDAADRPPATLDALRKLAPEDWLQLQLQLQPCVQLQAFNSNAPELWQALIKNQSTLAVNELVTTQSWLVWREDYQVIYRPLEAAEAWALAAFASGKTFADICNGLCDWFAEAQVPMQAAQYLQQWILAGLVAGINTAHH